MSQFDEYRDSFAYIALERNSGVLTARLHTDGGPFQWGLGPFGELADALRIIGSDPDNEVVILTGTGDVFCGPRASRETRFFATAATAEQWEGGNRADAALFWNHLDIPVPVICAVNGPAFRRSELALLADIVIASPSASFEDSHFVGSDLVPGDGLGQLMLSLLGPNLGRYALLTGTAITAERALTAGLIGEIVPEGELMARAQEIAELLMARPAIVRRSARRLVTWQIKRHLVDTQFPGLAVEAFADLGKTARE